MFIRIRMILIRKCENGPGTKKSLKKKVEFSLILGRIRIQSRTQKTPIEKNEQNYKDNINKK